MTTVTKFNGAVTFHVHPRTLQNLVMQDRLLEAVPEAAAFKPGSQTATIFENLGAFLAQTDAIEFAEELPFEAQGLDEFWTLAKDSRDYVAVWAAFIKHVQIDAHNEWLDAVNHAIPEAYRAPEFVQPGADTSDPKSKRRGQPT